MRAREGCLCQGLGAAGPQGRRRRPSPGQRGGRLVAMVRAWRRRGARTSPGHGSEPPLPCLLPPRAAGAPSSPFPSARAARRGDPSARPWPPAFRAAGLHLACPTPFPGPRAPAGPRRAPQGPPAPPPAWAPPGLPQPLARSAAPGPRRPPRPLPPSERDHIRKVFGVFLAAFNAISQLETGGASPRRPPARGGPPRRARPPPPPPRARRCPGRRRQGAPARRRRGGAAATSEGERGRPAAEGPGPGARGARPRGARGPAPPAARGAAAASGPGGRVEGREGSGGGGCAAAEAISAVLRAKAGLGTPSPARAPSRGRHGREV